MVVADMLRAEGREEGRKEGREEGARENALTIASQMLSNGFDEETILELTGLTPRDLAEQKPNAQR